MSDEAKHQEKEPDYESKFRNARESDPFDPLNLARSVLEREKREKEQKDQIKTN